MLDDHLPGFAEIAETGFHRGKRPFELSLRSEILDPLGAGLLSDTQLKIQELEQLRRTIAEAQEVKTREAISQAVIRRGQQVAHIFGRLLQH